MMYISVVSTLILAACGIAAPADEAPAAPADEAPSARTADSTVVSKTQRADWAFDVTCADGSTEVDSAEQIAGGLACRAGQSAKPQFRSMQLTQSHGTWGGVGFPDNWSDVYVKVMGTQLSAVFIDLWGHFNQPVTTDTVTLAADGSFTATGHLVKVFDANCPSLYTRDEYWLTLVGQIGADGTIAMSSALLQSTHSAALRQKKTCWPGEWSVLDSYWYESQQPAEPVALHE
jgi:hypothetical protein